MATADTNRVTVAFAAETGFAEDPPDPTPTLQELRLTSESLGQDTETTESQEIRDDRQTPQVIRTNINAGGGTNHELAYSDYDTLLKSALMDDSGWSAEVVLASAGAVTFAASGQTAALSGIDTSAVVGEWVKITGASNSANNGFFKISAKTTGSITLAKGAAAIVDETGSGVTVTQLSAITNGTTLDTYVMERAYNDLSNMFEKFFGMGINTFNLNVAVGQVCTIGFGWLGAKAESDTSTVGDGSNTAAGTNSIMNAVDNVPTLLEASGASADLCVQSFGLTLQNNLRAKNKIGTLGAFELGKGSIGLTGTFQSYFNDAAIIDSYLNFTSSGIAMRFADASSNVMILDIPNVYYTNARRVAGGKDQDVIADLSWTAVRDSTEDVTIRIVRDAA